MNDPLNNSRPTATKDVIATILSVTLGLFLADAGISLLDDTLILGLGVHALGAIRGAIFFFLVLMSLLVYVLSGVTPMIPKRFMLPVVLFAPVALLAMTPFVIFHFDRLQPITWVISLCQVIFALGILFWVQGTLRLRWPVVRQEQLGSKPFSWLNLTGFVLVNVFVLLPGVLLYLGMCASVAVNHFSGGFLALRPNGVAVRAKTYVRDDNKTVQLVPMMHFGEAEFYHQISKSLPTNSVVLLEGVSDNKNLIKHKLSYERPAKALGLVEQADEFLPPQARLLQADVDVEQFSEGSIAFLNLVSLIYSEGWRAEHILNLIQESKRPLFVEQIMDDLLTKREANLLKGIEAELSGSEVIVVPWGAAHMRGIAKGIQKSGFRVADTQEHQVVHFRSVLKRLFNGDKPKVNAPAIPATATPAQGSS